MLIKNIIEQILGTLDVEQIDKDNYIISGKYKLHIIRNDNELIGFTLIRKRKNKWFVNFVK